MAYKLKCGNCRNIYISNSRFGKCTHCHASHNTAELIGEVLDTAIDVAATLVIANAIDDVLDGVGDILGSLFGD